MDTGWLVAKYVNPKVTEAFEILDRQALTEKPSGDKIETDKRKGN